MGDGCGRRAEADGKISKSFWEKEVGTRANQRRRIKRRQGQIKDGREKEDEGESTTGGKRSRPSVAVEEEAEKEDETEEEAEEQDGEQQQPRQHPEE